MAEFVEYRLERGLRELECLQNLTIFTEDEIKDVVKKRTQFEYLLQRFKKEPVYYLNYIHYEQTLLRLIELRRKKLGLPKGMFREEIEHAISRHIDRLFRLACFRYPGNKQLWLDYIEFCRNRKWLGRVSALYSRMLQVHSQDPKLWLAAAHFEYKHNDATDAVRNLLMSALRFHPDDPDIWINLFKFEYNYAHKVHKRTKIIDIRDKYHHEISNKSQHTQHISSSDSKDIVHGDTDESKDEFVEQLSQAEREKAAAEEESANLEPLEELHVDDTENKPVSDMDNEATTEEESANEELIAEEPVDQPEIKLTRQETKKIKNQEKRKEKKKLKKMLKAKKPVDMVGSENSDEATKGKKKRKRKPRSKKSEDMLVSERSEEARNGKRKHRRKAKAEKPADLFGSDRSDDAVLNGVLLRLVYKRAIETIDPPRENPDFCFTFFQVLNLRRDDEITAIDKLKEDILMDLRTLYKLRESTWQMIAQESRGNKPHIQMSIYEQAIRDLPTSLMWSHYIEFSLNLLEDQIIEDHIKEHLVSVLQLMERCWKQQAMSPMIFSEWINLLNSTAEPYTELENQLKQLLHAGISKWPEEHIIWSQFFSIHRERSSLRLDKSEGKLLFERCIKHIASKYGGNEGDEVPILDLIKIYLAWLQRELNSPGELIATLDNLSKYNFDVNSRLSLNRKIWTVIKPMGLQASFKLFGILKTKLYYQKNRFQHPIIPQFFEQMIAILQESLAKSEHQEEETELICDLKSVYEDYLQHFGSEDYQIWLNLIKLEINHLRNINRIGILYNKAIKTLKRPEVDKFAAQYTLLKTEGKV